MYDRVDNALYTIAVGIGWLIAILVGVLLIGSLLPKGGSLDGLTAEQIKSVVDGGAR